MTSSALAPDRPARPHLLIGVATAAFVADALTKLWAVVALELPGRTLVVWRDHLELAVARNPGAAFSFLRDAPEALRRPLFLGVSVAAIAFVVGAYARVARARSAARWGLALVLGGALGNLVDRVRDASVVDFVAAHAAWGGADHRWPVFNVADVAITVGVALLFADVACTRVARGHARAAA